MSPWASDSQRRWGNSDAGKKALGKKKINEYNQATEGKKLSEKVKTKVKPRKKR